MLKREQPEEADAGYVFAGSVDAKYPARLAGTSGFSCSNSQSRLRRHALSLDWVGIGCNCGSADSRGGRHVDTACNKLYGSILTATLDRPWLKLEEELPVSLVAENWGTCQIANPDARRDRPGNEPADDLRMQQGIPNDSAPPDLPFFRFKLRLQQDDRNAARCQVPKRDRQDHSQGDE